jgi:3-hydroxyisobutyrate dehydrogenase
MFARVKVAVLGTGIMGSPMARNIAAAGLEVRAWNRSQEKAESLAEDGVEVADTPAEAVGGADVVVTMLLNGEAVLEVMGGAIEAVGAGAVWAQMGTVGIRRLEECAALAEQHRVPIVDAPVLGTKQPAEQGELVVLAAGPADARERCGSIFEAVGQKTVELDAVGDATRAKLVLNSWVVSVVESIAETMALAQALGVDKQLFLDTIKGGGLDMPYAQMKGRLIIEGEFPPSFPLAVAAKDVRLILEAAETSGVELPMLETIRRQFERGVDAGHGREDMISVFRVVAPS